MELNSRSGVFQSVHVSATAAIAAANSAMISIHDGNIPIQFLLHFAHCLPENS